MHPYHTDVTTTLYQGDALEVLRTLPDASVDAVVTDPPSGIAFMALTWDTDKGGRDAWIAWLSEIMRECYRVMKPGAHGLVWALPRTSHWTGMALENAGFEVRDRISHLFGNGFPKGLDVSQAIDKHLGAERQTTGTIPDRWAGKSCVLRRAFQDTRESVSVTAPATPEARQWDGWKTALKPAMEDWWLIRKPLADTVAANVLQYGTGALNIDACRVGTAADMNPRDFDDSCRTSPKFSGRYNNGTEGQYRASPGAVPPGRYPPHVLFSHAPECTDDACVDGCPVRELDEQSGVSKSVLRVGVRSSKTSMRYGAFSGQENVPMDHTDTGTATRFFPVFRYAPKAAPSEHTAHPTQKSLALMTWLVTLISTEGQTILDPFAGSGTTLVAARNLGRRAIGVEMNRDYCDIIVQRLAQQVMVFGEEAA